MALLKVWEYFWEWSALIASGIRWRYANSPHKYVSLGYKYALL